MLRTHVLPRWGDWPLARVDHLSVQQWAAELATRRKPATVAAAVSVLSMVMASAVRSQLIPSNPCIGLQLPRRRTDAAPIQTITRDELRAKLLPATPPRHRAMICLAAGAGLRWGECAGLAWSGLDLDTADVVVRQVAVETAAKIEVRPYPKSRAGFRRVPLPAFALNALQEHRREHAHPSSELVFAVRSGGPLRRSTFRRRVWVPALAEAGLPPSLGFHDLRHSYATWLISDGVPVNVVQRLMGHEQASTTLNRYVHAPRDYDDRVRDALGNGWC
jgi:integrase